MSLPIGAAIARLHGEWSVWKRWWLAAWLALVTHPLLDLMTVYGTQLARPFSDHPFAVGSVFIIDLLYTLPLLIGTGVALARADRRRAWNTAGLVLSTAYLGWGWAAQQHVAGVARRPGSSRHLRRAGAGHTHAVQHRAVAHRRHRPRRYSRATLAARADAAISSTPSRAAKRCDRTGRQPGSPPHGCFSQGFYKLRSPGTLHITDLRMGQEPTYTFSFNVAERRSARRR